MWHFLTLFFSSLFCVTTFFPHYTVFLIMHSKVNVTSSGLHQWPIFSLRCRQPHCGYFWFCPSGDLMLLGLPSVSWLHMSSFRFIWHYPAQQQFRVSQILCLRFMMFYLYSLCLILLVFLCIMSILLNHFLYFLLPPFPHIWIHADHIFSHLGEKISMPCPSRISTLLLTSGQNICF